jgi:Holliday junction resolvase RusA-like endonuclease
MTYRYVIPGIPPSMNQFLGKSNVWSYRASKHEWTALVCGYCRAQKRPSKPLACANVTVTFFFSDNRKRDVDNIAKPVLDGLKAAGVISDDCWQIVKDLTLRGAIDRVNPRTEIEVTEISTVEKRGKRI